MRRLFFALHKVNPSHTIPYMAGNPPALIGVLMQEKNFIRRGSRLANDATVLKISEYDNEQGKAYALCVFRNDFVTWELVRDDINSTVHGHYFFDLQMSLDSFEARCIDRGAVKPHVTLSKEVF